MVQKQTLGAQWLVFSREEQDIIDELVKVLPKSPFPGLQLAQITAENGCDYQSLIDDYQAKLGKVKVLEAQIEQETNQLSGIKHGVI